MSQAERPAPDIKARDNDALLNGGDAEKVTRVTDASASARETATLRKSAAETTGMASIADGHRRSAVPATLLILLGLQMPWHAAASTVSALRVIVSDASSGAFLPLSHVDVYGARSLKGGTGTNGAVSFDGLPDGTYEIEVRKAGYQPQLVRGIVDPAHSVVTVRLQREPHERSWLRNIGRVTSTAKAKLSATGATVETPEARITSSVFQSAATVPGLLVEHGSLEQHFSLTGHPASQTLITFGGAPLAPPGYALDVRGFDLDLFDSAAVHTTAALGAVGGSVNFEARDPTLDWIGTGALVRASHGANARTLNEQGTLGRLGVSLSHAHRDEVSPLNGLDFLDTSGLRYVHDAVTTTSGDAVKIRYPFSLQNVLVGTALSIRSHAPLVCDVFTGPVPCGYGPTNVKDTTIKNLQLRDYFVAGRFSGSLALFRSGLSLNVDQAGHYISGSSLASTSRQLVTSTGAMLDGHITVGQAYPVSFSAALQTDDATTRGTAFGTILAPNGVGRRFTSAALAAPILNRRHGKVNLRLAMQSEDGVTRSELGSSAEYDPTSYDKFQGEIGVGGLVAFGSPFQGFSDPSSFVFNCTARNAVGYGPADSATNGKAMKSALTWSHLGSRVLSVLTVQHEVDYDASVDALVGSDGFAPSVFGRGYSGRVQAAYASACQSPGLPFSLSNVYYRISGVVPRTVYDSLRFTARSALGRNVVIQVDHSLTSARALGSGGLMFSPSSTVVSGSQLPNKPPVTANAAITARLDRRGTTVLTNILHVSTNNANHLPSYSILDVGAEFPLRNRGKLNVSLLNALATHTGTFAGTAGAVPIETRLGSFKPIAYPLRNRSLDISLRLPFGFGAELQDTPNLDPGPNAYGYKLYPYPITPPKDPFAIDRKSGRCGPEAASGGTHSLDLVRRFASDVEKAREQEGAYPTAFPSRTIDGLTMYYRRNGQSFALLVGVDKNLSWSERVAAVKPLVGCGTLYSGFLPDTRSRGLYIPSHDEQTELVPVVDYAPEVGLYVPPSPLENDSFFPQYGKLPATQPKDAFAILSDPGCSSSLRPEAEAFVALIRPYADALFSHGNPPPLPAGTHVTLHPSAGAPIWIEIESEDVDVKSLSQCLAIAGATRDELAHLGLDGTSSPRLDYAPRAGFYNAW